MAYIQPYGVFHIRRERWLNRNKLFNIDCLFGFFVKQMNFVLIDSKRNMVAAFRLHAGRCAHDKFLTAAYSMDINFRTHHFCDFNFGLYRAVLAHFQECAFRMEVLRTDAENHRLSGVFRHQLVRELALRQRDEFAGKI